MDVEQFKEDLRQGRIDRDRLGDLLVSGRVALAKGVSSCATLPLPAGNP